VLHKIGVTGGDLARRLANAKLDPTFLMAEVEVVATYELLNINRTRLENVIHRIFGAARLDIEIKDRFGHVTNCQSGIEDAQTKVIVVGGGEPGSGAEAFVDILRGTCPQDRLLALQLGALVQGLEGSNTSAEAAVSEELEEELVGV